MGDTTPQIEDIAATVMIDNPDLNYSIAALIRMVAAVVTDTPISIDISRRSRIINQAMFSDDRQPSAPPAVTVVPAETAAMPVGPGDLLAVAQTNAPALAEPEMLVEGLRYLQRRIPEFTQMTWR